jgi:hypothetical protein
MHNIKCEADIILAITELEEKQFEEEQVLRQQLRLIAENIRPINLIKNTLREAADSQDLKNDLLKTVVGITAGFLTKVVLESVTDNPAKKVVGATVIYGAANILVNNPDALKATGRAFFNMLRTKPAH